VIRAGSRLRKSYVSLSEIVDKKSGRQWQLFDNIAAALLAVPEEIQLRQIAHFSKADSAYGQGVAARLGLVPKLQTAE
jgi:catalase